MENISQRHSKHKNCCLINILRLETILKICSKMTSKLQKTIKNTAKCQKNYTNDDFQIQIKKIFNYLHYVSLNNNYSIILFIVSVIILILIQYDIQNNMFKNDFLEHTNGDVLSEFFRQLNEKSPLQYTQFIVKNNLTFLELKSGTYRNYNKTSHQL